MMLLKRQSFSVYQASMYVMTCQNKGEEEYTLFWYKLWEDILSTLA